MAAELGDVAAQERYRTADAKLAAIASQRRRCRLAIEEASRDREELGRQRMVAEQAAKGATREQLANERLALAKELDDDAAALVAKMTRWRDLFVQITTITKELDEPTGRELPWAWEDLFAQVFAELCPLLFDRLAPDVRAVSTFTALSRRFATTALAAQEDV